MVDLTNRPNFPEPVAHATDCSLMTARLVGINIGTSKLVAVLAVPGSALAVVEVALARQETGAWLEALQEALGQTGHSAKDTLVGICGTSGTFLLTDQKGRVLGAPVMYNDSYPEAVPEVKAKLAGTRWAASDVISPDHAFLKLHRALRSLEPNDRARVRWVIPQSVWLSYALALSDGEDWTDVEADVSNCRKLGGQLADPQWPRDLCDLLDVPCAILPRIVPSGKLLGSISSSIGSACDLAGSTLFHGTTDASAEAMALVGDCTGNIGVIAGSTTSIKAVLARAVEVGPDAYLGAHPLDAGKLFYTAWVSVGENIRQRAESEGIPVEKLIEDAWNLPDNDDIPAVPLRRVPIATTWLNTDASRFVRGVMESAAWWEAWQIETICEHAREVVPKIHMIGGTARSSNWLQLRADAYQRPVWLYSAGGALGAVLPGLLLNGVVASSEEFLGRYRVLVKRVEPRPLSTRAAARKQAADSWIRKRD
jgi:D-ribulokinase